MTVIHFRCLLIYLVTLLVTISFERNVGRHHSILAEAATGNVALCLVGSAREFELTGPSILKHLISSYEKETRGKLDLFINSPLDRQSHKLWILNRVKSMAAIRVFPNSDMNESISMGIIDCPSSPGKLQGVLQYFRLVEGCLPLISNHEARNGFTYKWIIRTRLDTFWKAPPPPLSSFNVSRYTVPNGSFNRGVNDRFGVGGQEASKAALSRLTLLRQLAKAGFKKMNSEHTLKAQLNVSGIEPNFANFSFCVLSRRVYRDNVTTAVASIASLSPLNGAKCRPCTPRVMGKAAEDELASHGYGPNMWPNWIGPFTKGIDLCVATTEWEDNWRDLFDRAVGPAMASERRMLAEPGMKLCLRKMKKLQKMAGTWLAPTPMALCKRGFLDDTISAGAKWAHSSLLLGPLNASSVVYIAVKDLKMEDKQVLQAAGVYPHQIHGGLKYAKDIADSHWNGSAMASFLSKFALKKGHGKIDVLFASMENYHMVISGAKGKELLLICQVIVLTTEDSPEDIGHLSVEFAAGGFQLDRCTFRGVEPQWQCSYYSPLDC